MRIKDIYKRILWDPVERTQMENVRSRIKNKNFTIICSNCCGGWIYHMLGMRFDSPTINIWIDKKEFCSFAADLHYYLSQNLVFYEKEGRKCPCAYLGEGDRKISIDFVHYKTKEEALEKWEERKKRVHWDNLYIITCDGSGATSEDFELLKFASCKRKVVFTAKEHPEIEDSFLLHTMRKEQTAAKMQIKRHPFTGLRSWEREFDYVAWLNDEPHFRF